MLSGAGVLPASSLEASIQQQHEAEEEELGDGEAEVAKLGDAGAAPTVYTPSSSNSIGESWGMSIQQQQWDGDGVGGRVPQVGLGQNGSIFPFDPGKRDGSGAGEEGYGNGWEGVELAEEEHSSSNRSSSCSRKRLNGNWVGERTFPFDPGKTM